MAKAPARAAEERSSSAHDLAVDEGQALIAAAERKRIEAGDTPPPSTRRKRKPLDRAPRREESSEVLEPDDDSGPQVALSVDERRPLRPWTVAAAAIFVLVGVLSLLAYSARPKPLPVTNVQISWMPGPQIPDREVMAWIRQFPKYEQLAQPNDWLLGQLARFLKEKAAVADVASVRVYHTPRIQEQIRQVRSSRNSREVVRQKVKVEVIERTVEVKLALRQPFMPGVLRDGTYVWIDRNGAVLPGILPKPAVARPRINHIEAGGRAALQAAVQAWDLLEQQGIDRGLVTEIILDGEIDNPPPPGAFLAAGSATPAPVARGIVLKTRNDTRIFWGRPGEEKYGVSPEDRARQTVHTLTAQGDPARIATIQVRFPEPTYTLKPAEALVPPAGPTPR